MNTTEKFLIKFNISSYNRTQIGNDKSIIIKIYEFLKGLKISQNDTEEIIEHLAYLPKEEINIPLFLDLISKSLGFQEEYELAQIILTVKEIHDIYNENSNKVPLETYLKEDSEGRVKKIFLNSNNKYILKSFKEQYALNYVTELKFAAAMALNQKEYQDFSNYVDNYDKFQETYSPLLMLKSYLKVRTYLKGTTKLFWDILFGNEYIVSLNKHSISTNQIYNNNIYNSNDTLTPRNTVQLDLFTYQDYKEIIHTKDIDTFQLCTIYNSKKYPDFEKEKDFIMYYRNLADTKDLMELPKLKQSTNNYLYNIEQ